MLGPFQSIECSNLLSFLDVDDLCNFRILLLHFFEVDELYTQQQHRDKHA